MAPDGVVEAVHIASNSCRGLGAGVEDGAPDQFGFDRLEECLDHGVIVAISRPRHGDADAVATQFGLVAHRAVLAAAIRVVDQPLGRTPHDEGLAQGGERPITVQAITHCPADDVAGEQVDGDRQLEPS